MAQETTVAREGNVNPINSVSNTRGKRQSSASFSVNKGSVSLSASGDKQKNEIMKSTQDRFTFLRGNSVDDFIYKNGNGEYEAQIWDVLNYVTGLARLAPKNNNTGHRLVFKKVRGRWTGTTYQRRPFGPGEIKTQLF